MTRYTRSVCQLNFNNQLLPDAESDWSALYNAAAVSDAIG